MCECEGYEIIDGPVCSICGCELDWVECGNCSGDGMIDLYEEDAILFDPGMYQRCPDCNGGGGWLECLNVEEHQRISDERANE